MKDLNLMTSPIDTASIDKIGTPLLPYNSSITALQSRYDKLERVFEELLNDKAEYMENENYDIPYIRRLCKDWRNKAGIDTLK